MPKAPVNTNKKRVPVIALLAVALLACVMGSLALGRYPVAVRDIGGMFLSKLFPYQGGWPDQAETVLFNIRLPRVALACMVGCCLSTAGAAFQGIFQNPMASPDVLGASAGAAFGAALAILLWASKVMIIASAFCFSMLTVLLVWLIGRRAKGRRMIVGLILTGIMVGSLFQAGTSLIKLAADPNNQLPAITYWLMGSLAGVKRADVGFAAIPMLAGLLPLFLMRWRINLLTLGDEEAATMGISTSRTRLAVVLCATLITAASVAVSGTIGWVGLVVPHLTRRLVGSDYRRLMPACMLTGALFMLAVDDVARSLFTTEIPLGIITAFVGAPFFLYLIIREERAS